MKKHERYLTRRDRDMIGFVARYRIGTESMFQRMHFAATDQPANVRRVLRRLIKRGMLTKVALSDRDHYYVITRRGLRTLGLPPRRPRPLSEQSLPVQLAVASYCVEGNLQRLTNAEFRELYPELCRPGLQSSNYVLVPTPGGMKLTMLIVDRGGAARRIRGRVRRLISQRMKLRHFAELIRTRRFRIVVLTGFEQQCAKIAQQISRESFNPVEVSSAVVSGLDEILTLRR